MTYHSFAAESAATAPFGPTGPFQRSTGFLAAAVSSSRRSRVECGAVWYQLRVLRRLARNLLQRVDQQIELLAALALRRFDHYRALLNQSSGLTVYAWKPR